jgi:hypothetical protein
VRLVLAIGLLGLAVGLSSCSEVSAGCQKAINALAVQLKSAKSTSDIDQVLVGQTFDACDGPDAWKHSAGARRLGNQVAALSDMNGSGSTSSAALNFLCQRYDPSNFTSPCEFR